MDERNPLPPLRIHHLLAWMAVTAVLISVSLWFDRTARNGPPIQSKFLIAVWIALAIGVAGALSFVGYSLHWRSKGLRFPAEPGQWLLIEFALAVIGVVLWIAGSFVLLWIEEDFIEAFQFSWLALCAILLFALNTYIGLRRCDSRPWKIAMLALPTPFALLVPAFLARAIYDDHRRGIARHWTHWFGAIGLFAYWALCVSGLAFEEYF